MTRNAPNIVDLGAFAALRDAESSISEIQQNVQLALEKLMQINIAKMNGHELRKLRDRILQLRIISSVCSPAVRSRIEAERRALGRALRNDELAALLAPLADQWSVQFATELRLQ